MYRLIVISYFILLPSYFWYRWLYTIEWDVPYRMYYQTTVCVAEMFGAICVMMLAVIRFPLNANLNPTPTPNPHPRLNPDPNPNLSPNPNPNPYPNPNPNQVIRFPQPWAYNQTPPDVHPKLKPRYHIHICVPCYNEPSDIVFATCAA